jgi:hypothetical protein
MAADRPADDQRDKHLALDNPADQAWGARLLQTALERRRQRLASEGGEQDG